MAKAKKLPSGTWRVLVYAGKENGKPKYKSFTAPTRREAEAKAATYTLDRKERTDANMNVHDAIDRYITSKENVLSPSTIRGYRGILRNNLKDIMYTSLDRLTSEAVQAAISKEATNHTPKTVRNIHGLLSASLAMFAPDIRLNTTLPQKKKPVYYTPTDAEIKKLMEYVKGTELELAVLLAATGSLRRSEICALTVDDVQDGGVIINKAMVRGDKKTWCIKQPKSQAGYRFVPLPPNVIQTLRKVKEGRIFPHNPEWLSDSFFMALQKAGIPHFRLHDLRHYYASTLHAMGVPDKYIMLYGGWSSEATLHQVYQHAMRDKQDSFAQAVTTHFSDFLESK